MIWVDREVKKIKSLPRANREEWVDDMKTPSGRIHVGSLRGVVIHDLIYKVLLENKIKTNFSYVFNDMDPMDAIPAYLDFEKWEKYAGLPLYKVPSPEKGATSFAEYYAIEFMEVFNTINCHPKIIWSHDLYESGKMNEAIKTILDNADKIRAIYKKVAKADRPENWYPFNPVCEKCGRIGTTNVYKWDGEFVYYKCLPQMVAWAKGCGHEGKISPFNGNGKLPWKVDWPCHWKIIGITIEGSGKDHMSSGGSYDMAKTIAEEVLNYKAPYAPPYEWFTIKGKKMSSSKGIGNSAKEVSGILPPEVFRFLIIRTPINTHLDFDPFGDTILNLFDDYDRCLNAYYLKQEDKIPPGKPGEVLTDFARIIELSQVRPLPKKRFFISRFRSIVNQLQLKTNVHDFFAKQRGADLTQQEKDLLEERIKYAKIYLERYFREISKETSETANSTKFQYSKNQRIFLNLLSQALKKEKTLTKEQIQTLIFDIIKKNNLKPKEIFQGFYQTLIKKDFGPKAADLILETGINEVIKRIKTKLTE